MVALVRKNMCTFTIEFNHFARYSDLKAADLNVFNVLFTETTTIYVNRVSENLLSSTKTEIKTVIQRVRAMLARLGIERTDSIPDLNELLNLLFTPEFIIQFLEKINQAHDNAADRIDVPQFEACIRVMWLCHVCRCSSTTLFNFWKSGVNGGCMDKPEGFDKPLWSRFMAGLRHVRNSVDIDDSSWNQGVRFDPELKELGKSKYFLCCRYYIMMADYRSPSAVYYSPALSACC